MGRGRDSLRVCDILYTYRHKNCSKIITDNHKVIDLSICQDGNKGGSDSLDDATLEPCVTTCRQSYEHHASILPQL